MRLMGGTPEGIVDTAWRTHPSQSREEEEEDNPEYEKTRSQRRDVTVVFACLMTMVPFPRGGASNIMKQPGKYTAGAKSSKLTSFTPTRVLELHRHNQHGIRPVCAPVE
eukprot:CAMPEP_0119155310 /NCGR_PEP_ID=MMETSP1310-20130426/51681_1 /TAXON_ID=464262 /ORGANISM="Genus nov. species nov., Strain RCC2339" /LENGTH=108 /DNA_ID=CAMNT_0007147901 /DNA_START=1031 /DNA_END=1357 /DNA_ORIENTATION=-